MRKDPRLNAVYISLSYNGADKQRRAFWIRDCNWVAEQPPAAVAPDCAAPDEQRGQAAGAHARHLAPPGAARDAGHRPAAGGAEARPPPQRDADAAHGDTRGRQVSVDAQASVAAVRQQRSAAECPLRVRVRHAPDMYDVKRFRWREHGVSADVELWQNDQGIAPGQFAVFYKGDECLGSGVIAGSVATRDGQASVQSEE